MTHTTPTAHPASRSRASHITGPQLQFGESGLWCTGEFLDLFPGNIEKSDIKVRSSEIEQILGLELGNEKTNNILESLGFSVSTLEKGIFKCKAPSYRPDVQREIDIIEELVRIHGYDKIQIIIT